MNSLKKSNSRRVSLFLPFIIPLAILLPAYPAELSLQPFGDNTTISISGRNEFRFADGYNNSHEVPEPWHYLINSIDFRITAAKLYVISRFDVEEPSLGFNPAEPVHREYFSRRTLGLQLDKLTIEAGHVGTQFGRGLTLSCKEDREVEQYSLIDGVYGNFRNSFITVQGIAGRPFQLRNTLQLQSSRSYPLNILEPVDTILVNTTPDLRQRDMIAGIHSEFFLPLEKIRIPVLTSGSVSGGVVRFSNEVGPLSSAVHDKTKKEKFWYRPQKVFWLPSAALDLAAGDFGFSIENSWFSGSETYLDSSVSVDSSVWYYEARDKFPPGRATYISANGAVGDVSLLAEYKNYYYVHANSDPSFEAIDGYFIPPAVRYQHTWHLLNKHMISNLMNDQLAYNLLVNWSPFEEALFTGNITFGGMHEPENQLTISTEEPYWEAYTEWQQEISDRISVKGGFDYGRIDPDPPNTDVTFRTLAGMLEAGPFRDNYSFKLILENQLNDKPVRLDNGETYTQYLYNFLTSLECSFSQWFTVSFTFEHEELPFRNEQASTDSAVTAEKRNYAAVGILVKPFDGTTITGEYGSMSGGKKCTLGTCVDLPPFEGFKLTIESVF